MMEQILQISTAVKNTMYEHLVSGHRIDYPVRFEMYLEEIVNPDSVQFGRDMTTAGGEFQG